MKVAFGFAVLLLVLAGIVLVMLQGGQMHALGGGGVELTGVSWRAVTVGSEAIPADSGIYIRFEVDGSINGHGGCNGFFGSLERSDSGIVVGQLGSTRMACPGVIMDRETAFMNAVQKTRDFKFGSGGMSLLDAEGHVLATFVADTDE
jgi:putative lipoprotein